MRPTPIPSQTALTTRQEEEARNAGIPYLEKLRQVNDAIHRQNRHIIESSPHYHPEPEKTPGWSIFDEIRLQIDRILSIVVGFFVLWMLGLAISYFVGAVDEFLEMTILVPLWLFTVVTDWLS
jgi:hypothetical protein